MKITHVISDTKIGGAGRYLLSLLPGARRYGWEVTVAAPEGQLAEALISSGLCQAVIPLPVGERSFSIDLWRWLGRNLPAADLVHTHASLAGRLAAKQRGAKVVLTRHTLGPELPPGGLPGWKRTAHHLTAHYLTDALIAVSAACRQRLLAEGVEGSLIDLVYNGVDASLYQTQQRDEWRRRLQVAADTSVIVTVARLAPVKGLSAAVQAARCLRADGHQFLWLLVGEGPERANLTRQIADLGLGEQVRLLGFQPDIPGILSAADIFVLPSRQEALPLSVLEGMAASLPVVATRVGGIPELITDQTDGLLVPPAAPDELVVAVASLLENPARRQLFGQRARQKVLEQFTLEEMWRRTDSVYRRTLGIKG